MPGRAQLARQRHRVPRPRGDALPQLPGGGHPVQAGLVGSEAAAGAALPGRALPAALLLRARPEAVGRGPRRVRAQGVRRHRGLLQPAHGGDQRGHRPRQGARQGGAAHLRRPLLGQAQRGAQRDGDGAAGAEGRRPAVPRCAARQAAQEGRVQGHTRGDALHARAARAPVQGGLHARARRVGLRPVRKVGLRERQRHAARAVPGGAALAINGFVEANCAPEAVLAVLPQLVDALFKLMNDIGNEEVVQTLDNLIERYGEQMAPYAVQIVGALAQNFLRLFEEQEDEEDDDALAAMWVLQAISTMMEAVSDKPEVPPAHERTLCPDLSPGPTPSPCPISNLNPSPSPDRSLYTSPNPTLNRGQVYVQMEAALMPMLHKMMGESAREYFEDVNEVLSYLTYYSPVISEELWGIFPRLHEAFHTWAQHGRRRRPGSSGREGHLRLKAPSRLRTAARQAPVQSCCGRLEPA
eukprot:scaffold85894_cov67-Phaeocystis_antarctica.AAC.4